MKALTKKLKRMYDHLPDFLKKEKPKKSPTADIINALYLTKYSATREQLEENFNATGELPSETPFLDMWNEAWMQNKIRGDSFLKRSMELALNPWERLRSKYQCNEPKIPFRICNVTELKMVFESIGGIEECIIMEGGVIYE